MDITEEVNQLIGQPENEQLEYKAVLPPSRSLGQIICALANTKGGIIILGIAEVNGKPLINGLSEDFHANAVTHKAIDLLSPKPNVNYQYITFDDKRLYAIKVEKSDVPVSIEGKIYIRQRERSVLQQTEKIEFKEGYKRIKNFAKQLDTYREKGTGSKSKYLDHYMSVLNIVDDLDRILYPNSPSIPTNNQEGKILIRILFSSCADNFETYLSDLLYEIYLANPNSLKSDKQQVSIKEVLDCTDMQEFVIYWAKKKLSKLQRGSVKGFIADNKQIKNLNVIDITQQEEIEKILQIRHLYSHQNGRVDEKFLQYYSNQFNLNDEHQMSVDTMFDKLEYLTTMVDRVDQAAIEKFKLATI